MANIEEKRGQRMTEHCLPEVSSVSETPKSTISTCRSFIKASSSAPQKLVGHCTSVSPHSQPLPRSVFPSHSRELPPSPQLQRPPSCVRRLRSTHQLGCYKEIFGAHAETEIGDGLPDIRLTRQCLKALKLAGFEVSLCVKRLIYTNDQGEIVKGVCSNFLCDLKPGNEVKITGPVGKEMLMPKDPKATIIMSRSGFRHPNICALLTSKLREGNYFWFFWDKMKHKTSFAVIFTSYVLQNNSDFTLLCFSYEWKNLSRLQVDEFGSSLQPNVGTLLPPKSTRSWFVKMSSIPASGEASKRTRATNVKWTREMEQYLADILLEDVQKRGNRGDNGMRTETVTVATKQMNLRFNMALVSTNVKNKIKGLKDSYASAKAAINSSGFGISWDGNNKCLSAEPEAWTEYVNAHHDARGLDKKFFPLYEPMAILYAHEGAKGTGAVTASEARRQSETPMATTPPPSVPTMADDVGDNIDTIDLDHPSTTAEVTSDPPIQKPDVEPSVTYGKSTATKRGREDTASSKYNPDIAEIKDQITVMATAFAASQAIAAKAEAARDELWPILNSMGSLSRKERMTAARLFHKDPLLLGGFMGLLTRISLNISVI